MAAPTSRYVSVQTIRPRVRTFCFFMLAAPGGRRHRKETSLLSLYRGTASTSVASLAASSLSPTASASPWLIFRPPHLIRWCAAVGQRAGGEGGAGGRERGAGGGGWRRRKRLLIPHFPTASYSQSDRAIRSSEDETDGVSPTQGLSSSSCVNSSGPWRDLSAGSSLSSRRRRSLRSSKHPTRGSSHPSVVVGRLSSSPSSSFSSPSPELQIPNSSFFLSFPPPFFVGLL